MVSIASSQKCGVPVEVALREEVELVEAMEVPGLTRKGTFQSSPDKFTPYTLVAQGLAVLRQLGIRDDDARVNPNGGAIALGHPLGMSGARLVATAVYELQERKARYALTTMCIGVGQGIAALIERV